MFSQATKAAMGGKWGLSFAMDSIYQAAERIHVGGCKKELVQSILRRL